MAKKLKALAGSGNEKQLAQTIKDSAYQIWLAGLGAFAKAQEEGGKVFEALVKEGESVQKRTKRVAEDTVAEARKAATGTWDKLESVFEERVARALHSLNVPTRKDIDALTARVHDLTAATKKLSGTVKTETNKTAKAVTASAKKVGDDWPIRCDSAKRHRLSAKGQCGSDNHEAHRLVQDDSFQRPKAKCSNQQRQPELRASQTD